MMMMMKTTITYDDDKDSIHLEFREKRQTSITNPIKFKITTDNNMKIETISTKLNSKTTWKN